MDTVCARSYDMLIVDEAHHLKNQTTLNWKLVNAIQKTFLLLLTATPVQNNLEELYNLVTLLKPGHLKTRKAFKEQFVARGNPTDPQNRERLRDLLKEVMVRNTRSASQINLPPRFATTAKITSCPGGNPVLSGTQPICFHCCGNENPVFKSHGDSTASGGSRIFPCRGPGHD